MRTLWANWQQRQAGNTHGEKKSYEIQKVQGKKKLTWEKKERKNVKLKEKNDKIEIEINMNRNRETWEKRNKNRNRNRKGEKWETRKK